MKRIENNADFASVLAFLPVEHQHGLAKRFIASVVHLSSNPRMDSLREVLARPACSEHELKTAHDIAHSVYVELGPASDISEVRFDCQPAHFIAQAVMACSATVKPETGPMHLAQQVANYCRMAQTCASMSHGGEGPDFDNAELEYNKIVQQQFQIANDYLSSLES